MAERKVKSIFITATGTDIGKTYISGLIVKKMRENGFNCGYYKPVLSGGIKHDGELIPGDCEHVVKTAGLDIEPVECLSYCFEEAVSPHLASFRAGINIDINKILSDYNKLAQNYDYMVIEGAGGITCPIILNDTQTYLMSDLIKDMNQNILIVADGGLGTLNSILLTTEYAKQRNIGIKGIILNNYKENDFMYSDNKVKIISLTGINVVATTQTNASDINIEGLETLFE